jgi:orotidine-5'-phosphate decarboxylase
VARTTDGQGSGQIERYGGRNSGVATQRVNSRKSSFSTVYGVMLAMDMESHAQISEILDLVAPEISAIKIGNLALYLHGVSLIRQLKARYQLPIIADLKLTDVSHIACPLFQHLADAGADAVVVNGCSGRSVLESIARTATNSCELWVFTEFTHSDGLIDERLAERTVRIAIESGVTGLQVPGTRPYRIEDTRLEVGSDIAIMACGIGVQGAKFGSAILAGANLEIVGRAIYGSPEPLASARQAREEIQQVVRNQ